MGDVVDETFRKLVIEKRRTRRLTAENNELKQQLKRNLEENDRHLNIWGRSLSDMGRSLSDMGRSVLNSRQNKKKR